MAVITITSDWGYKDPYLAAVKGCILSRCNSATIIDLSNEITAFDIEQAAYVVRNAFPYFPENTIHIIGINTEASKKTPHLLARYQGHYFIGADNGIFSLLFNEKPEKIIEIDIPQDSDYFTFSARDVFVKVACHIANGGSPDELGAPSEIHSDKTLLLPTPDENSIRGNVIYIDNYENAVTNIPESLFRKVGKNRKFAITFRTYEIIKISKAYTEVPVTDLLALFGSNGLLQIAINRANAAGLTGLKIRESVRIDFFNPAETPR